ncbi:hypothetical protein CJF31_00005664 [Rutstroemia sp. NJR-2017a BVV2]|nr:hypothetical protein CJF31_00005664 [Rutstroemia sp. NJR-2017a BVV2]
MEDAPQVVQDTSSSLGGNYAPANSCTSSNRELSGLTLPSFEQFHDQSHIGLGGTEDDPFAFDPELERTIFGESPWDNGFTDAFLDTEQISLMANTAQFEGDEKPTSNHSPSSPAASGLHVLGHSSSQPGTSSGRTVVTTISNISPLAPSEPSQKSLESKPSDSGVPMLAEEKEPCCETVTDIVEAHHETRPLTQEDTSSKGPLNTHLSQPAPHATSIPATGMSGSSSYHTFCHQAPQSFPQADSHRVINSMTSNPGNSTQQTFSSHNIPDQIIRNIRSQSEYVPDQAFNPNHSMRDDHRATDQNWTTGSSYPSPPSSDLSFDSFPHGNRDLIRPELRAAIERFEKKVETDEEVRQAFDIVFPSTLLSDLSRVSHLLTPRIGRSAEVEQLKNTIVLERQEAASRERALHKIIAQLRLFLPSKDQLKPRMEEAAETLFETPKENPYWMCRLQDLRITTQPCGGINQEWYLEKSMWILRRKCSKCMRMCGTGFRQRVSDDFVEAINVTLPPQSSERPSKKRKPNQTIDLTKGETYFEAAHRLSLPAVTSVAEANALRAESSRATRSLSPHPSTRTKVGTFKIPESTQAVLRQRLGHKDGWIRSHKNDKVIYLDGDNETLGEGSQQEAQVGSENGGNGNDDHEAGVEAVEADLEADMMAECEAAGL